MTALRTINLEDGITILRNLHALDMASSYCDRIIGMADGKVVFDGPPAALSAAVAQQIYGDDEENEDVAVAADQRNRHESSNPDEEFSPAVQQV